MAYKPDKHGRDHCPGGEDPIPCLTSGSLPWVRRKRGSSIDGGTSPATSFAWGGDTPLEYDDGGDENHNSVAGSDDWQDWFDFPTDYETRVLQDGYYLIKGNIHWDDMDNDKTFLVSLHDGFLWPEGWTFQTFSSWESPSHMWQTWKRKSANESFFVEVQFTGNTDEDASSWYIEVTRLGAATGDMVAADGIGDE